MGSASVRPWLGSVALGAILVQCATASSVEPADAAADVTSVDVAADEPATVDTGAGADGSVDVAVEPPNDTAPPPQDASADVVLDAPAPLSDSSPACGAMQTVCGAECVSVSTDARHCGGCGRPCASGERCASGACHLSCPTAQSACMGGDGVLQCVSLASDRLHCGACGSGCLSGQVCTAGRCVTSCPTGQVACATGGAVACADLTRDPRNCGMCNLACLPTERCEGGMCRLNCPVGQSACAGACVSLASDARNCGACANACPAVPAATSSCVMGRCAILCRSGFGDCNALSADGCEVDLATSGTNCGACRTACRAGLVCTAGSCSPVCAAPTTLCGGSCVNLSSSERNCGACGNTCLTGPNATAVCASGRCGITCAAGRGNCDGVTSNGCEVDLASASSHCGGCSLACAGGSTCVMSACTAPRRVIEDFDTGVWPRAPWVSVAGGGTVVTGCAHDGARGIQDPGWYYRTDTTVGSAGQRLSAWVRGGTGRFYLGFGASSAGAFSFVAESNTSHVEFQNNSGYGYNTLATAVQSFVAGRWYRIEVAFNSGVSVTGRVYDADGVTVLQTLNATVTGFVPRGIAMRSFGSYCADTLELR